MTDKPKKPFVRDNGEGGKHVKTLTMERLKDGTQQYIRGDTNRDKILTVNGLGDNGDDPNSPLIRAKRSSIRDLLRRAEEKQ